MIWGKKYELQWEKHKLCFFFWKEKEDSNNIWKTYSKIRQIIEAKDIGWKKRKALKIKREETLKHKNRGKLKRKALKMIREETLINKSTHKSRLQGSNLQPKLFLSN